MTSLQGIPAFPTVPARFSPSVVSASSSMTLPEHNVWLLPQAFDSDQNACFRPDLRCPIALWF
jgi:hypothetical protein